MIFDKPLPSIPSMRFNSVAQSSTRVRNPIYPQQEENMLRSAGEVLAFPQRKMTEYLTGTYQDPSTAFGLNPNLPTTPIGGVPGWAANMAIDMIADPLNLIGAGIGTKIVKGLKGTNVAQNAARKVALSKTPKQAPLEYKVVDDFGNPLNDVPNTNTTQLPEPPSAWADYYAGRITREKLFEGPNNIRRGRPTEISDINIRRLAEEPSAWADYYSGSAENVSNLRRGRPEQFSELESMEMLQEIKARTLKNKSGFNKKEILERSSDKDFISKLNDSQFEETVLTPKGELLYYEDAELNKVFKGKDRIIKMSEKEYIDKFNENIGILNNEILPKYNKSGIRYEVASLDEAGFMTFNTPKQPVPEKFKEFTDNPFIESGEMSWIIDVIPGKWKGDVKNIADTDYYKNIPGINMWNSGAGVFPSSSDFLKGTPGTGAYKAINEYLKLLELGRVKPGFNSQTGTTIMPGGALKSGSKDIWEHFIKSDQAYGFYHSPYTVHGALRTLAPIGVIGTASQYKK
jgi:hypothetical protein